MHFRPAVKIKRPDCTSINVVFLGSHLNVAGEECGVLCVANLEVNMPELGKSVLVHVRHRHLVGPVEVQVGQVSVV